MGLWQEMKSGNPAVSRAVSADSDRIESGPAGRTLIDRTAQRIAERWQEIEDCGGSMAWEWILRGSPHGEKIGAAEDRVNAIGSRGDPSSLAAARDAWVNAWREGIETWKLKAHSRKEA
jgi:hypothetical protein